MLNKRTVKDMCKEIAQLFTRHKAWCMVRWRGGVWDSRWAKQDNPSLPLCCFRWPLNHIASWIPWWYMCMSNTWGLTRLLFKEKVWNFRSVWFWNYCVVFSLSTFSTLFLYFGRISIAYFLNNYHLFIALWCGILLSLLCHPILN